MSFQNGCFTKSSSVINFSPGPAKIPEQVLDKLQREFHEYENTGISILELSHRSKEFDNLLNDTKKLLRDIMQIPQAYEILFLQGGGTGQFSGIPMNFKNLGSNSEADYLVTGNWSAKAAQEAKKYLNVNRVIDPPMKKYTAVPDPSTWTLSDKASYFYYCANETIEGVEFFEPPNVKNVPIVADISSNILSAPVDVSKFGLLFAGAQKNLGTSGVTVVIVRNDLVGHAESYCPSIFDYKVVRDSNSNYNTPPVFCIYVTKLVLEWMRDIGGIQEITRRNECKASMIYDVINRHNNFYHCPVDDKYRSRMNISFRIGESIDGNEKLEKDFLHDAEHSRGMISLKGYRTVGGVRASLYNAVTEEETIQLAEFMDEFYDKHRPA